MQAAVTGIREVLELAPAEAATILIMAAVTAGWFAALGASLGSFLNVVVYRMPRGLSLSKEGSRCPQCGTAIWLSDNIPILGWLRLRGRCRACRGPISPRYPLVETLVAAQFVGLLFVEVVSGGSNLPVREPEHWAGVVWMVWYAKHPEILLMYAGHLTLWYVATGLLLMAHDRSLIPRRWIAVGLVVGIVLPIWEPQVLPVLGFHRHYGWPTLAMRGQALWSAISGLLAGLGCGWLIALSARQEPCSSERTAAMGIVALAGLFLGPHAAVSVALATTVLRLVSARCPGAQTAPLAVAAWVAVHLQVLGWRTWSLLPWWPHHASPPAVIAGSMVVMACLAWWQGRAKPPATGLEMNSDSAPPVEKTASIAPAADERPLATTRPADG